jgi:hypothetical protein
VPLDQLIFTVAVVSGAHFHEEFRSRDMVIFFGLKDKSMTSPLLTGDDNPNDQIIWLKNDTMQSSSSSSSSSRSPLMATNNSSLTASTRRTLTSLSTSGSASVPSLQSKSSQKSYKTELSQEEQMKRMSNWNAAT